MIFFRFKPIIYLLLFIVVLFGLFSSAIVELVGRWWNEPEYGHGFLIPICSFYFAWLKRDELSKGVWGGHWLGWCLLFIVGAMLLVSQITALYFLAQISFIIYLAAAITAFAGLHALRVLLFPLLFLFFAIPVPYFLEVQFTAQLQLISSGMAVEMIRVFGIPVYLEGNVIDLGAVQLEVVQACSGLRYLYPLMSVGVLVAYFYRAPLWRKALVCVSTIPITLLMNSLRIAITALLVEYYGVEAAQGFFHDFEGLLIFSLCLALLVFEIACVELLLSRRAFWRVMDFGDAASTDYRCIDSMRIGVTAWLFLLGSFVLSGALLLQESRDSVLAHAQRLQAFPMVWPGWQGQMVDFDEYKLDKLKVDDYLLANYSSAQWRMPVNLYVAFYAEQKSGQSPHSPKVCIPGGGWEIKAITTQSLDGLAFNRIVVDKEGSQQLVYYWFVERGVPMVGEYARKWALLYDAFYWGRSDGALIRLTTPVAKGESIDSAEERLQQFLVTIKAPILQYLPLPPVSAVDVL